MFLQACGSFKFAKTLGSENCKSTNYKSVNHKKDWVLKSQIRKMPHLRKVRKSYKLFKDANLGICGTVLRTAHL